MPTRLSQRAFAALMVVMILQTSCTIPGSRPHGEQAMAAAIERFIDGHYEDALPLFEALAADSDEETRVVAHLYMGRCRLIIGDYAGAADAFSAGRLLGGGAQFDAYLEQAQAYLSGGPRMVRLEEVITRGQLAALITRLFALPARPAEAASDKGLGWASAVVEAGLMTELPDGRFHAEAPVTQAAFYTVAERLAAARGGEMVLASFYPGGYREALARMSGPDVFVTGSEAVTIVRQLAGPGAQ